MYRNHVEFIGFLGRDAEAKTTPNGKTVTTFSIAT
jgi:single-stranded DNA-binding protein